MIQITYEGIISSVKAAETAANLVMKQNNRSYVYKILLENIRMFEQGGFFKDAADTANRYGLTEMAENYRSIPDFLNTDFDINSNN